MTLLVIINIRCFIFKSSPAECLRDCIPSAVFQIFSAKYTLGIRIISRTFESTFMEKVRISFLGKNYLVLTKNHGVPAQIKTKAKTIFLIKMEKGLQIFC